MTPEVKLLATLAGLCVGLVALFWGLAIFLQGYLYNQIAERLPLRAVATGVLVACGLAGWTLLNTRASHPDKYGVLIGFDRMMTPTSSKPVTQFEAVRQFGKAGIRGEFLPAADAKEQTVKVVADGRDGFVEAESRAKFAVSTSNYLTKALVVPDAGGPARFEAVLDNGRYTPEKRFTDPAGRTIDGTAPGSMQVPSGSALLVGLLVNAAHILLWVLAFWLGMRFALGHAVGLGLLFGGATMVVLMPLVFNANAVKPAPPAVGAAARA